jgi:hypothetical protein
VSRIFPSEITAGLTLSVPLDLPDYPSPDWTVSAHMRGAASIDIEAVDVDGVLTLAAAPLVTGAWTPGAYWIAVRATDGVDVVEIESGQVRIRPDLAAASAGYDGRSHAERVLASIEAVIEGRATLDQESYKINNRELKRTPLADLQSMRARYAAEVATERRAARGVRRLGRDHRVTF